MIKPKAFVAVLAVAACGCDDAQTEAPLSRQSSQSPTIHARGTIISAERKVLLAPHARSNKPFMVSWIVQDGARVGEGDVVVRFDREVFAQEILKRRVDLVEAQALLAIRQRELEGRTESVALDLTLVSSQRDAAARLHDAGELVASRLDRSDAADDLEFLDAKSASLRSRNRDLASDSRSELGVLVERVKTARVMLRRAEADIDGAEVRAPHAGIVSLERNWTNEPMRVGDSTFGGKRVATLSSTRMIKALVHVPEVDAQGLVEGAEATVTATGVVDGFVRGKVSTVSEHAARLNALDPVRYFAVEMEMEMGEAGEEVLLPGRSINAQIVPRGLESASVVARTPLSSHHVVPEQSSIAARPLVPSDAANRSREGM